MIEIAALVSALIFGVAWGAAENRLWKEAGESVILAHFKLYHLSMATLFGWVNALTAFTVLGNINVDSKLVWYLLVALLWIFLMVWDTLLLDVSWWSIRFRDFKVNYAKACLQYGETNAWHERPDWDNAPLPTIKVKPLRLELVKPPLICGIYWWWWLFSGILAGLAIAILSIIF